MCGVCMCEFCVCMCVCGVCMCVVHEILYANSVSIIGRVLSEKLTGNQVIRFVLNLRCVSESKMYRQSTVMRGEVVFVFVSIDCCQGQ